MSDTYTGRKSKGKRELHSVAFFPYAECRMMLGMTKPRIYLKEWRIFRSLTQNQVVDRLTSFDDPQLPQTGASLSRLENGKQPYSQRVLEALADIYDCEPHQLIGHNPNKAGEIVDLMSVLDERAREKARAYLEGLKAAQ